jgi:hypothetical protein
VPARIIKKVRGFNRRQWLIVAAFACVLLFTGYEIWRSVTYTMYWQQHRDVPIAGWMTIGYISHSYHVPPPVLNEAAGLPPDARDHRPLRAIAKSQNRNVEELIGNLKSAVEREREIHPPPLEIPPADNGGTP